MATEISFSNRDWKGLLADGSQLNFTGNATTSSSWVQLDIGGLNNFPTLKLIVTGSATSPASFGSNPSDKVLYLEVSHAPRGLEVGASVITSKHPLIKWQPSQTSTVREIITPIEIYLNTSGRIDGNVFIRIISNSGTFTNLDMSVQVLRNFADIAFSPISSFSTTNNLYNTSGNGNANSVEELPSSTSGYVESTFTKYGYFGDLKLDTEVGFNNTASIGDSDPRYYWDLNNANGFSRAVHNGTVIVSDIVSAEGDVFRVNRNASGTITYLKNGVVQATGGTTDTGAMKAKFTTSAIYSRILGVRMDIGAGAISPTFENKVNIQEF